MVPKQRNSGITCNSRPVHCCSARRRSQHRPGRTGRTPSRSTRRSWGSRGNNPYFPLTPEYRLSYKHRSDAVRGLAARLCRCSIGQRIPRGARLGAGFRRKPILLLLPLSLCCVGLSVRLRASRNVCRRSARLLNHSSGSNEVLATHTCRWSDVSMAAVGPWEPRRDPDLRTEEPHAV